MQYPDHSCVWPDSFTKASKALFLQLHGCQLWSLWASPTIVCLVHQTIQFVWTHWARLWCLQQLRDPACAHPSPRKHRLSPTLKISRYFPGSSSRMGWGSSLQLCLLHLVSEWVAISPLSVRTAELSMPSKKKTRTLCMWRGCTEPPADSCTRGHDSVRSKAFSLWWKVTSRV